MFTELSIFFTVHPWLKNLVLILLFFLVSWVITRLSRWIAKSRFFKPRGKHLSPERQKTLQSLIASVISFLAITAASIASLSLFVDSATLVWVVGLFSAAFGLGARPVISDFFVGFSFLFEDTFAVGEKVEILNIEGVIETINLRTTWLRSPTGELFTIPNGEIRTVRNFSRGRFSIAEIKLSVAIADLSSTLELLENLSKEAMLNLPNLVEPWRVLSESGTIGNNAELTILAKARYGKAAEMHPRLLSMVHEKLQETGIQIAE